MKKIIILGGGTAGWMAAILFAHNWAKQGIAVELIESSDIGIIGVGEGSTPALKLFFDELKIDESEWMPECNATYKCGIRFENWTHRQGHQSYFHPFASVIDKHSLPMFMHNTQMRLKGLDLDAQPDRFFISNLLAKKCLAPKVPYHFPFEMLYGYHFDSHLLGKFIAKKAKALGVTHRVASVISAAQTESGDISSVTSKEGETFEADFFVDATGFASMLLQKTLQSPFVSYKKHLFNDAAVTLPSAMDEKIPSETLSIAMNNGWRWKIPLTHRFGNGYVYASDFCSADQAEEELRRSLGLLNDPVEARHLKMKVGRVETHWLKNCLGVGLSQGFIEPLEATALFLVQQTIGIFIDSIERGQFSDMYRNEFNQRINQYFDNTRDYIITHYKTSNRQDTDYWKTNTQQLEDLSPNLVQLYNSWMSGKDIAQEVERLKISQYYSAPSWYCIMAGMGVFPEQEKLRQPNARDHLYDLDKLDDFLERCSSNFPDHKTYLSEQKKSR